jgi:hypothetical protein
MAASVSGAEKASVDMAVTPWPMEQPKATVPPTPISAAPSTCRPSSRGSSQASQRKSPRMTEPENAPQSTPATMPTDMFRPPALEVMK